MRLAVGKQFIIEYNAVRSLRFSGWRWEGKRCLCKNYVSLITKAIRPLHSILSRDSLLRRGAKKGIKRYTFSALMIMISLVENPFLLLLLLIAIHDVKHGKQRRFDKKWRFSSRFNG